MQEEVKQKVAETATSIKTITMVFLSVTLGLAVGATWYYALLFPGLLMGMISILCYLFSPAAYSLKGDSLVIHLRLGRKVFGGVKKCYLVTGDSHYGVRLWGNGGLFSATGLFWSRDYGVFRAYVTTGGSGKMVMVETSSMKIIISPEQPARFIKGWENIRPSGSSE